MTTRQIDAAEGSGVSAADSRGEAMEIEQLSKRDRFEFNKLQKRLRRNVGRAIEEYNMIEAGDRVMVCLSGGKDSYTLLDILLNLRDHAPLDFELIAVNLDQKQPGFPQEVLPGYLSRLGVPFHILERDTYSIVKSIVPEGKTTCGLCSRLRRGNLYSFAQQIGATKIALGHHRDDIIETLFLNLFHGGKLKAMPPKLLSDDGRNVVIRPLAFCTEEDIAAYAQRVVIVPGYGLAVAQAQHTCHEFEKALEAKGVEVNFAIHPVAGRMPGHMNVLLAEADVPYDKLKEMEEINPQLPNVDVLIVIGANDVVNPAAETDPSSPIYGMPIIKANTAKNVIVMKRSMAKGYAGIENELFYDKKTRMLFGDAKATLEKLIAELKNA